MITKKQKNELIEIYKDTYYSNTISKNKNGEYYLLGLQHTMEIVGFTRNDFINLKNDVMEKHHGTIYTKWNNFNDVIDDIAGEHKIFLYDYSNIDNIIDNYDYDKKRIGLLKNLKFEIKKEMDWENKIQEQLQKQIY